MCGGSGARRRGEHPAGRRPGVPRTPGCISVDGAGSSQTQVRQGDRDNRNRGPRRMHLGREHSGDHTLVPVAIGPADERRTRAIRTSWSPSPPLTAAACTGGHTGRPHAAASGRPIQERTGAEGSDQTVVGDWPPPKTSGAGTLDIVAIDDVARDRPDRAPRRRAGPFRHHGATLRASRVRHPGGIRSAVG